MKTITALSLSVLIALAPSVKTQGVDLPNPLVVNGETFQNPTYRSHDELRLAIGHDTGLARLAIADLPKELRDKLGYDESAAAKAAESEAAIRRAEEEQKKAAEKTEAASKGILVLSWQWRESSDAYFEAVGEIVNESDRRLENVQVEVTIRDADDKIVSTNTSMANDMNLSPGQQTRFQVLIRRHGGEEKASLAFRNYGLRGGRYPHREK